MPSERQTDGSFSCELIVLFHTTYYLNVSFFFSNCCVNLCLRKNFSFFLCLRKLRKYLRKKDMLTICRG